MAKFKFGTFQTVKLLTLTAKLKKWTSKLLLGTLLTNNNLFGT